MCKSACGHNCGGFSNEDLMDMWAGAILDRERFTGEDAVLVLHGDLDESDANYPAFEDLKSRGFDVIAMATCVEQGVIDGEGLGELIRNQIPADVDTAIEHLLAHDAVASFHPDDPAEVSEHLRGQCSCFVEYLEG